MDANSEPAGAAPSRFPTVWGIRHAAVCAALAALAFLQAPGTVVADTKVDLVVNPIGWLGRTLHLWTSNGTFGQLQDQAYGYLWPMGPFFAAGYALGLPAWAVQRLWWVLLMCVAYVGVVRLAGRMRIGTPTARMLAAAAFALSPRILTQLGTNSVEAWPSAVAPWVLIPLIPLATGGSIRRAAALSGLAVACAGGVNATAVLALLALPLLWLLQLTPLRRRWAAIAAWALAVAAATLWWVGPLLIFGRYSPPFLDFIETAEVTTRLTDAVTTTRGASYWLAYLAGPYGPSLPAGWRLATVPLLIVATVVVAAAGVAGLARRGVPYRRVLVTCLVAGIGLVGLGHVSALDHVVAGVARDFLDGPGAPLRNVHKFDVMIRLPLALGAAHLLGTLLRAADIPGRDGPVKARSGRPWAVAATALFGTALVLAASPALAGVLAPAGGFQRVPSYWRAAAAWLNEHQGRDRVLVVPAASAPHYRWGATTDEITQALLTHDWAVRNAIPLTPPTTIRLLDAVETALASGNGSAGLADLLARSGVRYVLVRADLDYGRMDAARPIAVRQALARSPGFSLVASFGPMWGGGPDGPAVVDHGLDVPVRAIEVLRVERPVAPVVAYNLDNVSTVVGGPESLLELAAAGRLTAAPTVLAGDRGAAGFTGPVILTDGLRRREVAFGEPRDNVSATLTPEEPYDAEGPAHDYLPAWAPAWSTTARYLGVTGVRASSSAAQARVLGGNRPEHLPFAALDDDPGTAWWSAPGTPATGQWLEIELARPTTIEELTLHFDLTAPAVPTKVTVVAGIERATVEFFSSVATVRLPGVYATRSVQITINTTIGGSAGQGGVGISDVDIPGVAAARTLVTPAPPGRTAPDAIVLSAAPGVGSCFFVDGLTRCAPGVARGSEDGTGLDRTVSLPSAGRYQLQAWARPQPGLAANTLLDQLVADANPRVARPSVLASSTAVDDPAGRPGAAIDGDPSTAWVPAAGDDHPLLRLSWPTVQEITGLRVSLPPGYPATRPGLVRVIADDGLRGGFLDSDGTLTFDHAVRTDDLTVMFLDARSITTTDPYTRATADLPVAVGELTLLPAPQRTPVNPATTLDLPCGSGPTMTLAGRAVQSRVSVSAADLLQRREVPAEPCLSGDGGIDLGPGEQRVIATAGLVAAPTRLALTTPGAPASAVSAPVTITSWTDNLRRVSVGSPGAARVLAVRENVNAGWRATAGDVVLTPVTLDGWQQGWIVPAGISGEIVLTYRPDQGYRVALATGLGLLLLVLVVALIPARRLGLHSRPPTHGRARREGRLVALLVGGFTLTVVGGGWGALIAAVGAIVVAYRAPVPYPSTVDRRLAGRLSRRVQAYLPPLALLVGGWLALSQPPMHQSLGPQLAGLVMVAAIWLSVVGRPAALRNARSPSLRRSFEQVVAQRRQQEATAQREQEHADRVAREQ